MKHLDKHTKTRTRQDALKFLAPSIVHDFNNLLTVIGGNVELVMMSLPQESKAYKQATAALSAVERAHKLAKQLMSLTQHTASQPAHLQLIKVIDELRPMIKGILGSEIDLHIKVSDDLPNLHINLSELENCLLNLSVNARDAMNGSGSLSIHFDRIELTARDGEGVVPGDYVHIQVKDTGAGISATDLPHIFEPFYTTKTSDKGNGLGLASVLSFVKKSKGFIDVETCKSKGTTFHLYLPEGIQETKMLIKGFTVQDLQ